MRHLNVNLRTVLSTVHRMPIEDNNMQLIGSVVGVGEAKSMEKGGDDRVEDEWEA